MRIKVFAYIRVSSEGQVKGHGPRRQKELIEEFAAKNGYEVVAVYQDAHTGAEADRPQFAAMLAALMDNGVRVVIVESLDRLARDLMVQMTLLAKLAAEGVTLIAANTGENVTEAMRDDPMREGIILMQGVFAHIDKKQIVRKLKKAREAMRQQTGRCEGRKPYGFREGEQAVLDRMHRLHRKRRLGPRPSATVIAAKLNAEGFRNRSGGEWTAAHVRKLMR